MRGPTFVIVFFVGSDFFTFLSTFCCEVETSNLISKHMVTKDEPGNDNM